jgi:hypothetical protein
MRVFGAQSQGGKVDVMPDMWQENAQSVATLLTQKAARAGNAYTQVILTRLHSLWSVVVGSSCFLNLDLKRGFLNGKPSERASAISIALEFSFQFQNNNNE